MYARGLTTRQISEQIEDIYGFECSESFISNVTDKKYKIFKIGKIGPQKRYIQLSLLMLLIFLLEKTIELKKQLLMQYQVLQKMV